MVLTQDQVRHVKSTHSKVGRAAGYMAVLLTPVGHHITDILTVDDPRPISKMPRELEQNYVYSSILEWHMACLLSSYI